MTAKIVGATKEVMPVFDAETNQDQNRLMVVSTVEFWDGDKLHHAQTYAHAPEDVSPGLFQRQAEAMQNDVDHSVEQRKVDEASRVADQKIAELLNLDESGANTAKIKNALQQNASAAINAAIKGV